MIGIQQWRNTYNSIQGNPISNAFRYKRDPKDKIERVLKKSCLNIGGTPTWIEDDITYTLDISDTFKDTRTFISRPKSKEPYTKTIAINSMPAKELLPEGLLRLLFKNHFKLGI